MRSGIWNISNMNVIGKRRAKQPYVSLNVTFANNQPFIFNHPQTLSPNIGETICEELK